MSSTTSGVVRTGCHCIFHGTVHCPTCYRADTRIGPDGRNPDCRVCFPLTDERGRRLCTYDTGGDRDVYPGALVTWLHVPRGGYGYVLPIDGKVIRVGKYAHGVVALTEVTTKTGRKVQRRVLLENLRWTGPQPARAI